MIYHFNFRKNHKTSYVNNEKSDFCTIFAF